MRTLFLIAVLLAWPALAGEPVTVLDVHGARQTPLELKEKKAAVLFFVLHDCPIANGYAPEINRICAEYAPKGYAFFVVHIDPGLKAADARKHAEEYGFRCPILLDGAHALAKLAGATVTPEAAVFGADGKVLYRGRIDDLYTDLGKKRAEPRQRDLRAALDALSAGKPVPTATTQAVGCLISETRSGKK